MKQKSYKSYQGHIPRQRFAQHFLKDSNIIDNIVSAINPIPGEAIIEIGPGLGALTKPVADIVDQMIVIELDRDLANRLKEHPTLKEKLTVYQKDVMNVDFALLEEEAGQSLRIFGNLPYNISTPLMFYLFGYNKIIRDMHFMLQKEVLNRLVAYPHNKEYGRLTVMVQYYCNIIPILSVPSVAFTPVPKVDSYLVRLVPHKKLPNTVTDTGILKQITTKAFNQRRKIICNSLNQFFTAKQLTMIDIDPNVRAENISVAQYCQMANYLSDKMK